MSASRGLALEKDVGSAMNMDIQNRGATVKVPHVPSKKPCNDTLHIWEAILDDNCAVGIQRAMNHRRR